MKFITLNTLYILGFESEGSKLSHSIHNGNDGNNIS